MLVCIYLYYKSWNMISIIFKLHLKNIPKNVIFISKQFKKAPTFNAGTRNISYF